MSPQQTEEVRRRHRSTHDTREKERCQAVLLAYGGRHTYEEIAEIVGRSRSTIQRWIKDFTKDALGSLSHQQGQGGGKPTELRDKKIQQELRKGLRSGRWMTAREIQRWLQERHGVNRSLDSVYYWLGKLAGALKVPRPVHAKKNVKRAADFKEHLYRNLKALELPVGRKVRVWVQDEARYGLHTVRRRCWGLRGVRVVKPVHQKYEWGYVYGALDVVSGEAEFCFLPSVSLELTCRFLEQIVAADPEAEHVIIWDQAGFHHTDGDLRLPERIHLLPLPPYSPELNPTEKLWDIIKDQIANRVFETLEEIESVLSKGLRPYWSSTAPVRRLVGDGWLHTQANAT
jgi:transposase